MTVVLSACAGTTTPTPAPAPTTPAPAPSTPAPAPPATCSASVSNIYPSAGGGETVNVTSSQPGASFTVVARYPSTAASYSGTTSGSGAGSVAFTVANVPAYTM